MICRTEIMILEEIFLTRINSNVKSKTITIFPLKAIELIWLFTLIFKSYLFSLARKSLIQTKVPHELFVIFIIYDATCDSIREKNVNLKEEQNKSDIFGQLNPTTEEVEITKLVLLIRNDFQ